MCSNTAARLAAIGEAIEQLAAEAASGGQGTHEQVAGRLAAIWDMMAELDPGLARKLRGYIDSDQGGRVPGTP